MIGLVNMSYWGKYGSDVLNFNSEYVVSSPSTIVSLGSQRPLGPATRLRIHSSAL